MPKIRFVWLRCRCGGEVKLAVERVAEGGGVECPSCGRLLDTGAYAGALEAVRRYSEAVAELERRYVVEEDALRLRLGGASRLVMPAG